MNPKAGYGDLARIAHYAAESSTGTNVNVATPMVTTKSIDTFVYYIDRRTRSTSSPTRTCPSMPSMAAQ